MLFGLYKGLSGKLWGIFKIVRSVESTTPASFRDPLILAAVTRLKGVRGFLGDPKLWSAGGKGPEELLRCLPGGGHSEVTGTSQFGTLSRLVAEPDPQRTGV